MMRIAFVGKGGAGKSSLAGTVARLFGRNHRNVLAIDSDPVPGLAYALGVQVVDRPIPDDVVVEGAADGPRWVLRPGLDAAGLVEQYAPVGPDDVRYLQFGNLWGSIATIQRAQHAWSQAVRELPADLYDIVGDLPGGTRQPMAGWGKYADLVIVVVEPTVKSLHSARRLLTLSSAAWGPESILVVANKVRDRGDVAWIADRLGRAVDAASPWSEAMIQAERCNLAPLDAEPESDFVAGARALVESIELTYRLRQEVGT